MQTVYLFRIVDISKNEKEIIVSFFYATFVLYEVLNVNNCDKNAIKTYFIIRNEG